MTHKHSVQHPSDIAVSSSEVWIGGESVECFSIERGVTEFSLPINSLKELGISKISTIATDGDSILYILSEHGDKLAKAAIVRETTGK